MESKVEPKMIQVVMSSRPLLSDTPLEPSGQTHIYHPSRLPRSGLNQSDHDIDGQGDTRRRQEV